MHLAIESHELETVGAACQFGISPFAARGLLPGPFETGRFKRRPQGWVYVRVLAEDPLLRTGALPESTANR
jgi:hypothetical protein